MTFGNDTKEPGPVFDQGIKTDKNYSPETLVRDLFVKGGCKNVSNIRPIGDTEGIGYFDNGGTSIAIDEGIILSTGHIRNAEGPNVNRDKSGDFADERGDRDLNILAERRVEDAVGLEFDFVPLDSVVNFQYVFASEEYCEFVGTKYNDVFGFFVSGPGINGPFSNGAINVALIPNTNDYVSINSVNHLQNAEYYNGNELPEDAEACGIDYEPSDAKELIQFDGFTAVMSVNLRLVPCQTYHIRLVVGDLGDNYFDSAVFLKAKSFSIGGDVKIEAQADADDNKVSEGCSDGAFIFARADKTDTEDDVTVPFKISLESTADESSDFLPFNRSIIIPAGQKDVRLPVSVLIDSLRESPETLILELDYPCECITDTAYLYLTDPPPIDIDLPDQQICPGDSLQLRPGVSGGHAPYRFEWDTKDTISNIWLTTEQPLERSVVITDNCGQIVRKNVKIDIREVPEAFLDGDELICEGEKAILQTELTGIAPFRLDIERPDGDIATYQVPEDGPFSFDVNDEGLYIVKGITDKYCDGIGLGEGLVTFSTVRVVPEVIEPSCHAARDGAIEIRDISGNGPFDFRWYNKNGDVEQVRSIGEGQYFLDITDAVGCVSSYEINLEAPEPLGHLTYDCEANEFSFEMLSAQGGTPPYSYSVDGGQRFAGPELFSSLRPTSVYDVTIKDANGCLFEQKLQMPTGVKDFVKIQENLVVKLGDKYRLEPQLAMDFSMVDSVAWFPGRNLTCDDCLRPVLTTLHDDVYQVWVKDIFGCEDDAIINVILREDIRVFVPTAFSPNGDGLNDKLIVFGSEDQVIEIESFQIFDRWGNRVFERRDFFPNDANNGWDGRLNGKRLRTGVYIYNVQLRLVDNSYMELNGSVNLFGE